MPASVVAEWTEGIKGLPDDRVPCPGLLWREYGPNGRDGVWTAVREMMLRFCRDWGDEAASLGWSTIDLFGVHRRAAALRIDSTGCLVSLYPMTVLALDERTITLGRRGSRLRGKRLTNPSESVPIWAFRATA